MKKISKKIVALLMIFAMLLNYMLPIKTVSAAKPSNTSTYGIIEVHGAIDIQGGSNTNQIIGTYNNGTIRFTGSGLYADGSEIYAIGEVGIDITPEEGYTGEILVDGVNTHGTTTTVNAVANGVINVEATFEVSSNTDDTKTSTVTVSAGEGTYNLRGNDVAYDDMIDFKINGDMWDHGNNITYRTDSSEDTVMFTFESLWIDRYYDTIKINDDTYTVSNYIDYDDRTSWLTHNNGSQLVSFNIPDVPKADSYTIIAKHGENNGSKYLATFLWTADPAQAGGHNYIGHSTLEFVKAVYTVGETEYTVTEDDLEDKMTREGDFMVAHSDDGFLNYGVMADVDFDDGSLTLPGNAQITMRVVPDYGYQVTSVNGGSDFTTTDEGVSEFTVTVADGTAGYFQAEVTKVDDEVLANSEKVSSGTVELAKGSIDSGTVRLSVDDIDLTEDKITDFENYAGSDYNIKSYLDINLNKVLYKGTADDVWSEQIHHLNKKALITLKLEDGVDVSNIVIVHNIDNGEKFEIIEIESYDPETNTITFYTDSFSNYAIATKTASEKNSNPKTGDNLMFYISMLGLSVIGLTGLYTKKRRYN